MRELLKLLFGGPPSGPVDPALQPARDLRPASAAADVHAPAANTAAVVTYAAKTTSGHAISGVAWSYDGDPTGGNLKVEAGAGNTIFSIDITAAGPGVFYFDPKKGSGTNVALIVTLAAGGVGVKGKVNGLGHIFA